MCVFPHKLVHQGLKRRRSPYRDNVSQTRHRQHTKGDLTRTPQPLPISPSSERPFVSDVVRMSEGKYSSEGKDGGGKTDEGKTSAIDAEEGNAEEDTLLLALVNDFFYFSDTFTDRMNDWAVEKLRTSDWAIPPEDGSGRPFNYQSTLFIE